MARDNGLDGGSTEMSIASTSRSHVLGRDVVRSNGNQKDSDNKAKEKEVTNLVPFHKLFSFVDSTDVILMIVGTIGAVGNGLCLPLMTILLGELTDAFGRNQNNDEVVDKVTKVALKFVYLALGAGAASFLQVACWMITGERQSARIRNLYLRTILRQDVTFFDMETNTAHMTIVILVQNLETNVLS